MGSGFGWLKGKQQENLVLTQSYRSPAHIQGNGLPLWVMNIQLSCKLGMIIRADPKGVAKPRTVVSSCVRYFHPIFCHVFGGHVFASLQRRFSPCPPYFFTDRFYAQLYKRLGNPHGECTPTPPQKKNKQTNNKQRKTPFPSTQMSETGLFQSFARGWCFPLFYFFSCALCPWGCKSQTLVVCCYHTTAKRKKQQQKHTHTQPNKTFLTADGANKSVGRCRRDVRRDVRRADGRRDERGVASVRLSFWSLRFLGAFMGSLPSLEQRLEAGVGGFGVGGLGGWGWGVGGRGGRGDRGICGAWKGWLTGKLRETI